jgi:3D (Asp-Asp-Asp) domain-containing protein
MMFILVTAIGLGSVLNKKVPQPINTPIVENKTDSIEIEKELVGEFKLTFYTPSPDETDDSPHITATGATVKPGITVAVDPRYWKLGTKFYIEGYGYVVAEDTGSKINGPHAMDVSVETKDEAFKKGIQYRKVWIVKA